MKSELNNLGENFIKSIQPLKKTFRIPRISALYVIVSRQNEHHDAFRPGVIPPDTILYIGKTEGTIKKNIYDAYIDNFSKEFSILNKSLGEIIIEENDKIPKSKIKKDNVRDIQFISQNLKNLTLWASNSLSIGIKISGEKSRQLDIQVSNLVERFDPLLNRKMSASTNPHHSMYIELRKICKSIL